MLISLRRNDSILKCLSNCKNIIIIKDMLLPNAIIKDIL